MNKYLKFIARFNNIAAILLSLSLFASCAKENPPTPNGNQEPVIKLSTDSIALSSKELTSTITVESNKAWSVTLTCEGGTPDWVTVSPMSGGAGSTKLNITLNPNENYEDRSSVLRLTSGTVSKEVVIKQLRKGAIILSEKNYNIDCEPNKIELKLETNVSYEYKISNTEFWISHVSTKALKNYLLTFNIEANRGSSERTGYIVFYDKSNPALKDSIKIKQGGTSEYIAKERAALIAIYNALDGDNWTKKQNWCSDKPLDEWEGVRTYGMHYVQTLELYYNNAKGVLPADICKLNKLLQLTLYSNTDSPVLFVDESVCNLPALTFLNTDRIGMKEGFWDNIHKMNSLKQFTYSAHIVIPNPNKVKESIWELKNLERLSLFGCEVEMTPRIGNMKSLIDLDMFGVEIKGDLPSEIENCTNLKKLIIHYGYNCTPGPGREHITTHMIGTIPPGIGKLVNLEELDLAYNDLSGPVPADLSKLTKLKKLKLDGNRLTGVIPESVRSHTNWQSWDATGNIYPQQTGYGFITTIPESTDFSQNGRVFKVHSATKGPGINIVIAGDGFIDTEIGDGKVYDVSMRAAADYFLNIEPYKSYNEYFNIFYIRAVSRQQGMSLNNSTLDTKFSIRNVGVKSTSLAVNTEYVSSFVKSAGLDDSRVIIISNSKIYAGTCHFINSEGKIKTIALCTLEDMENVLHHEANGHGFGLLADEYVTNFITIPEAQVSTLRSEQSGGLLWQNVDFTSDKSAVKWKNFFGRTGYESVGVYEGANYYRFGVWRSEESSCMVDNRSHFNAPSREAIVKRIRSMSGEQFNFEDFIIKDQSALVSAPAITKAPASVRPKLGDPVVTWR